MNNNFVQIPQGPRLNTLETKDGPTRAEQTEVYSCLFLYTQRRYSGNDSF